MKEIIPQEVQGPTVRCDGGAGPLGHPAIYLSLEKTGEVTCPYCSRVFIHKTPKTKAS